MTLHLHMQSSTVGVARAPKNWWPHADCPLHCSAGGWRSNDPEHCFASVVARSSGASFAEGWSAPALCCWTGSPNWTWAGNFGALSCRCQLVQFRWLERLPLKSNQTLRASQRRITQKALTFNALDFSILGHRYRYVAAFFNIQFRHFLW